MSTRDVSFEDIVANDWPLGLYKYGTELDNIENHKKYDVLLELMNRERYILPVSDWIEILEERSGLSEREAKLVLKRAWNDNMIEVRAWANVYDRPSAKPTEWQITAEKIMEFAEGDDGDKALEWYRKMGSPRLSEFVGEVLESNNWHNSYGALRNAGAFGGKSE